MSGPSRRADARQTFVRRRNVALQRESRGRLSHGRTHLCDTERDVADIQPTGLPGHLTAHDGHWGGCDSQAVRSHGGQERCGWNLSRS